MSSLVLQIVERTLALRARMGRLSMVRLVHAVMASHDTKVNCTVYAGANRTKGDVVCGVMGDLDMLIARPHIWGSRCIFQKVRTHIAGYVCTYPESAHTYTKSMRTYPETARTYPENVRTYPENMRTYLVNVHLPRCTFTGY